MFFFQNKEKTEACLEPNLTLGMAHYNPHYKKCPEKEPWWQNIHKSKLTRSGENLTIYLLIVTCDFIVN